MKWYKYRQNNSGGSFVTDTERGIAVNVMIEAPSADAANELAEGIGLYFDGDGDCPCCGDRWYPARGSNGEDAPNIYGQAVEPCAETEADKYWGSYLGFMHPFGKPFQYIKHKE